MGNQVIVIIYQYTSLLSFTLHLLGPSSSTSLNSLYFPAYLARTLPPRSNSLAKRVLCLPSKSCFIRFFILTSTTLFATLAFYLLRENLKKLNVHFIDIPRVSYKIQKKTECKITTIHFFIQLFIGKKCSALVVQYYSRELIKHTLYMEVHDPLS